MDKLVNKFQQFNTRLERLYGERKKIKGQIDRASGKDRERLVGMQEQIIYNIGNLEEKMDMIREQMRAVSAEENNYARIPANENVNTNANVNTNMRYELPAVLTPDKVTTMHDLGIPGAFGQAQTKIRVPKTDAEMEADEEDAFGPNMFKEKLPPLIEVQELRSLVAEPEPNFDPSPARRIYPVIEPNPPVPPNNPPVPPNNPPAPQNNPPMPPNNKYQYNVFIFLNTLQ